MKNRFKIQQSRFIIIGLLIFLFNGCKKEEEEIYIDYPPIVVDIDRHEYPTVRIGNQIWMAENLKVKHFRNGELIPLETHDEKWGTLTTGAYCYNNSNLVPFPKGYYYNWYVINDKRNIAPKGWHVPSDSEWTELNKYVTGPHGYKEKDNALMSSSGWFYIVNLVYGQSIVYTNGDNASGFNAYPSGYRDTTGTFLDLYNGAGWWSTSISNKNSARIQSFGLGSKELPINSGLTVRCIMD